MAPRDGMGEVYCVPRAAGDEPPSMLKSGRLDGGRCAARSREKALPLPAAALMLVLTSLTDTTAAR